MPRCPEFNRRRAPVLLGLPVSCLRHTGIAPLRPSSKCPHDVHLLSGSLAVPIQAPSAFRSRAFGPYPQAVAVPCLAAPLFCWHHGSALATSRVSCAAASWRQGYLHLTPWQQSILGALTDIQSVVA